MNGIALCVARCLLSRLSRQNTAPPRHPLASRISAMIDSLVFRHLPRIGCILIALAVTASRAADRPNAILIIGDDISWDDFGCYGNASARTPHIDRLARNGVLFTNAYLTASSCSPSRSSIATGRYPHNNGAASELHRPIASNIPRFPALLREKGYYTVLSGKNHMSQEKPPAGVAPLAEPFEVVDAGQVEGNHGAHGKWVEHLQMRPKDRPFFFWFASLDAHRAWDADSEWDESAYGPKHDPAKVKVPPFLVDDAEGFGETDLALRAGQLFHQFLRGRLVLAVCGDAPAVGELQGPLALRSCRELYGAVLHVGEVLGQRAADPVPFDGHGGESLAEGLAAPARAEVGGVLRRSVVKQGFHEA